MAHLVDTPILLRLANTSDVQHTLTQEAVLKLRQRGEILHTSPQNLVEFRNAATPPAADNGLGFSSSVVEQKMAVFEALFPLLPETPDIYPAWKALVQVAGVIGKQVHDARLVAVCQVYGISHILTFNLRHFNRLVTFVPGILVVDPISL